MSVLSVTSEIAALTLAHKRAQESSDEYQHGGLNASASYVFKAATDAAAADPANSATILRAAETKLSRYAHGDPLMKRKARRIAAGIESTIRATNAQAAADASAAAIAEATTAAQAPVVALQAIATAAGSTVERVTHAVDVMAKAAADAAPDRLARIGHAAAEAVHTAAMEPAHEAALAV